MSKPIWKFISAKKKSDGSFQFNPLAIAKLKDEYKVICQENGKDFDPENDYELDKEVLKKLMENLGLMNSEITRSVIESLMFASDATIQGIIDSKLGDIAELSNSAAQATSATEPSTTDNTNTTPAPEKDQIICIIHLKSTKKEIFEFFKDFLFRLVRDETETTSNEPICDGQVHPLIRNSLLDLFIRQQLEDRGDITSMTENETRYRLVEPVSLSDEFEAWTFDHFRGLFNIWLSLDAKSETAFPKVWKFKSEGQINYMITDHLSSKDDSSSKSQSDRPNTKSLPNFIHDVCRIEGNGQGNEWLAKLAEENITTYGHLSNLNQQEWSRIQQLRMNALKTIKFYVDQAKQMVEERKVKKVPMTTSSTTVKQETYSISEILADLHMIKLYMNYQLAGEEGIESLPQLEQRCVELAFDEMRAGGYEEDGLFDQMKLFFQPLTVKDDELKIDDTELGEIETALDTKSQELLNDIQQMTGEHETKETERQSILDQIRQCEIERENNCSTYEKASAEENLTDEEQQELLETFNDQEEDCMSRLTVLTDQLKEKEKELQTISGKLKDAQNERDKTTNLKANKSIERKMVKVHRGFIMYGPPGTGKSVIMTQLAKKIGIAMLGPPLAAGELERPLVGQSEAVIADLCMRGNRLPHLMCCVSIDEIDSLAPKRDEDSSEGKVAKISVLLSVIEGIKDVKNLMFFSATNRLHMMDEAFLRRMSGKFFVGRPSALARERILNQVHPIILRAELSEKLAIATTNFSGAALRALTSAITVHYLAQKRKEREKRKNGESTEKYVMSEEEVLELADQTARQYQIFLGLDTLPRLFLQNLGDRRRFQKSLQEEDEEEEDQQSFHLPDEKPCTGKILISLHDRCVRIETFESKKERYVIERDLEDTEENLQQLLERITWYGRDRNVQLLQLIDLNLLSSRGAYEEKKIFETLKERYDECMEYTRSMIVYDLDSLVGVSESESDSSTGTSVSTSLVNQGVYIYITSRFREAKIEAASDEKKQNKESWAIAVVRNPFLLKKFANDVDFPLTETQKREQEEARRRAEKVLYCVKCRDNYTEDDNKMAACSHHDGFVYDNLSDDLQVYTPSQAIDLLNQEEYFSFKGHSDENSNNATTDKKNAKNEIDQKNAKDDVEKKKQRFKYICCHAVLAPGASFNGCKKGKHGWKDEETYVKMAKKDQKDPLTVWENYCLKNKENLQRKAKLLKCREAYRQKLEESKPSS